jgi:CRISPR system Cascade subunit CasD
MAILYMRLASPMQSWGAQSRFTHRDTGLEPSKSGVIGLLCAALGKPRDEDGGPGLPSLSELAELKMGIRVDRQGTMERDYHTAGGTHRKGDKYGVPTSDGKQRRAVTSERFYLSDAVFLVALQGEDTLLKELHEALKRPVWQLYLGRKAFLPDPPVYLKDGFQPQWNDLEEALRLYPYLCQGHQKHADKLRTEIEVGFGQGEQVKHDQPLSFSERLFALRYVKTDWIEITELPPAKEGLCIFPS